MFQFFKDFFDKHPKQEEGVEKSELITDMFKKHYYAEELEDQKIEVHVPFRCQLTSE